MKNKTKHFYKCLFVCHIFKLKTESLFWSNRNAHPHATVPAFPVCWTRVRWGGRLRVGGIINNLIHRTITDKNHNSPWSHLFKSNSSCCITSLQYCFAALTRVGCPSLGSSMYSCVVQSLEFLPEQSVNRRKVNTCIIYSTRLARSFIKPGSLQVNRNDKIKFTLVKNSYISWSCTFHKQCIVNNEFNLQHLKIRIHCTH